jgi:hypothetical protein
MYFDRNCKTWREMRLKRLDLHMDNAPANDSRQMGDELNKLSHDRISHLSYPPKVSFCEIWGFGFIKDELKGRQSTNGEAILDPIWKDCQK